MKLSGLDCQKNYEFACYYQIHSWLNLLENKPQMNADERRFVNLDIWRFSDVYQRNSQIKSPQSTQRRAARIFASSALWFEKINNELKRTPYELTLPEFVSVRISSVFFLCSFMKQGFIADFAVKSRSYLRGLFDINSAYVAAFIRIHPRLIFRRKTQEALA